MFTNDNEKICYAKNCLDIRGSYKTSNLLAKFVCKHIEAEVNSCLYAVDFSNNDIAEATPDETVREKLMALQNELLPTVVEILLRYHRNITQSLALQIQLHLYVTPT